MMQWQEEAVADGIEYGRPDVDFGSVEEAGNSQGGYWGELDRLVDEDQERLLLHPPRAHAVGPRSG